MGYYKYRIILFLTKPVRWLFSALATAGIPWFGIAGLKFLGLEYDNTHYAIRLLFSNNYKFNFVFAQALLESGRFGSTLAKKYNNIFAMGYVKSSPYQDGSYIIYDLNGLPKKGEPVFATYKNKYRAIYDYYHCVYVRKKAYGEALDKAPDSPFEVNNKANPAYISYVSGIYKANGYFLSDAGIYARNIWKLEQDAFSTPLVYRLINILSVIFWVAVLYYLVRIILFFVRRNKKKPQKQEWKFNKPNQTTRPSARKRLY